jgi:hypothetical protein
MALALLEREILDSDEIETILNGRPLSPAVERHNGQKEEDTDSADVAAGDETAA